VRSPRFRMPARRVITASAVAFALGGLSLAAVGPTAVAAAGNLIGSADIQNDSIVSRDIKNGTIIGRDLRNGSVRGKDIQDGSITAADLDADLDAGLGAGLQGVVGPAGPKGDRGPAGRQADGVATWTVHHDADGQSSVHLQSVDTIPAGASVEPLDATVTGDFSGCNPYYGRGAFSQTRGGGLASFTYGTVDPSMSNAASGGVVFGGPTRLTFDATCLDMYPAPTPLPTFDATITFQWTVLDATPTTTFN
jgi:hypothetical protein